eukprot:NP_508562.1 Uncharacterized protein CELE_K09C4.7 [Caenorhabditis elegans]
MKILEDITFPCLETFKLFPSTLYNIWNQNTFIKTGECQNRGKYESPDSRLSNYLESVENHSTVHWGDEKCSWQLPWHRSRYSKDLLNRLPYQSELIAQFFWDREFFDINI